MLSKMKINSGIINDPSRVITFANFISLFRAFLAIPIIYSMVYPNWNWLTGVLILIAILSDALDGYFARKLKQLHILVNGLILLLISLLLFRS